MFPWSWKSPFSSNQEKENQSGGGPFPSGQFQKYMDQMMNQMFPPQFKHMMNSPGAWAGSNQNAPTKGSSPFQETVFETHDDVYVRLSIGETDWLHNMKVSYNRHQCIITDSPEEGESWTIQLPAIVKKKGARALYKDGILEIKIPKSMEWQETEIELPPF
ncbi:spore germination protein GerT [Bacillus carboniphilus]|uniref:Spore germination protein GerT n=1 Tax=Bacillus carboniphilus TaxID=86663 RepID=A0ABN0WG14_9BACI